MPPRPHQQRRRGRVFSRSELRLRSLRRLGIDRGHRARLLHFHRRHRRAGQHHPRLIAVIHRVGQLALRPRVAARYFRPLYLLNR